MIVFKKANMLNQTK